VRIIDDEMIICLMAVEEYTSYGCITVVKRCLAGWHM